jgi:thioredoxin reductase (NADPH)
VFLAESTKRVYVLIRSAGLADTMSRYLIRRIEETPAITPLPHTEIFALEGRDHLDRLTWRNNQTAETEEKDIPHVFVMTGAIPNTDWLDGCVALDNKRSVKTGPDLSPEDLSTAHWPLDHRPYLLKPASQEFSRPVMCGAATSNALRLL